MADEALGKANCINDPERTGASTRASTTWDSQTQAQAQGTKGAWLHTRAAERRRRKTHVKADYDGKFGGGVSSQQWQARRRTHATLANHPTHIKSETHAKHVALIEHAKGAALTDASHPPKITHLCLSIFLVALLIFIQPILPSALKLDPTYTTEAHALEGTTNYSDMFHMENRKGTPGYIKGSTLRAASTYKTSDYIYDSADKRYKSSAGFVSNKPISLLHDWTIEYTVNRSALNITSSNTMLLSNCWVVLSKTSGVTNMNGKGIVINEDYGNTGSSTPEHRKLIAVRDVVNSAGLEDKNPANELRLDTMPTTFDALITYSYLQNSLTFRMGSFSKSITDVTSIIGSQAYLGMVANFNWRGNQVPSNSFIDITFKSMSMPHLEPSIESLSVYPEIGNTPYGKNAMIKDGATVRVECVVRNKYASPGSEQYSLYLKTVNDSVHPTQGVTPLIDSSHPLTVTRGSTTDVRITSATDANSIQGANGVPVILVGSSDTKVTYYAKVNQGSGAAIRLSQCLTENSFRGAYYATTELFSEKALVEGSDASSGANYSRVPSANANGWNAGPVSIEFHANGMFDAFDIKSESGVVGTLTEDENKWVQVDDTDGMPLTYRARNTGAGVSSTAKSDVIRIDTLAPDLKYDRVRNELVASDAASVSGDVAMSGDVRDALGAAHATSGIWKVIRADKQDLASCAASDGKVYTASGGRWNATETFVPVPGAYVAIDAAGNVSEPVEVVAFGAPSIIRPGSGSDGAGGTGDDPGDGSGNGDEAYTGPVFAGAVPEGEVTVDENGLNHRVIQEGIFEVVDNSMDRGDLPFGGTLDADVAKQLIDRNYSFSSPVSDESPIDVKVELVDARTGKPVDAVDTSKTGEYVIRAMATDSQGNTTTVDVVCRFANKDDLPQVTPKPGTPNLDDPFGELIVKGDEKEPSPLEVRDVQLNEETGRVTGTVEASLYVPRSDMVATPDDISTLISNRYDVDSLIGAGSGSTIKRGQVVLCDSKGEPIDEMDLSKTGTWVATQTFTDNLGNETTLRVTITNKKRGSGSVDMPTDTPPITITPATDVRLDPESTGTVKDEPYFEHDADKPLNVLDVLQVRPEGAEDWSAITGSGNGSGDGSNGNGSSDGSGNGSGDGNGSGSGDDGTENGSGTNPGGTTPQLSDGVKVVVTDESGSRVNPTNVTDPGTYEVIVSVKDADTGEFVVVDTIKFHIVDTSITDTDLIYRDVPKDHWGHGYIFDIGPSVINGAFNPSDVALGYMAGYAGTKDFGPHHGIIRGDAAIVIWRMAGCPDVDQAKASSGADGNAAYLTGFADCDANPTMYWNEAIAWCASNGIVTGYEDTGLYLPQNQITREEFASIIARYAAFKGKDVASASADLSQYPDIDDVSDWAAPNMHYVVANGIMTGKGTDEGTADGTHGILDPQASVTRAEVAKMTYMEQPYKL